MGLVVHGTECAEHPFSASNGLTNNHVTIADLPFPHQAGEHGRFTNTAEALLRGYKMLLGKGSRSEAHKVVVFMSDGQTTVHNGFDVISDFNDPDNVVKLQSVKSGTAWQR